VDPVVTVHDVQEAMTASVSVISGPPDSAAAGVNGVRGCAPMIAGCRSD